jgi:hypothetical protein
MPYDRPRRARGAVLLLTMAILGTTACRTQEQVIAEQRKALVSLRETTRAIGEAWLAGSVSGTYARTALEATEELLEKQRQSLATLSPDALADPNVQALSDTHARLGRTLALLWKSINERDSASARQHLSSLSSQRASES